MTVTTARMRLDEALEAQSLGRASGGRPYGRAPLSVQSALAAGDPLQLPSRRDEDWRWSDLRGLLRALPPPSPAADAPPPPAWQEGLDLPARVFVNGRPAHAGAAVGRRLLRRFVAATPGASHHAQDEIRVEDGESLLLVDSVEAAASGCLSSAAGAVRVGRGASLDRLVVCGDAADAVSVSRFDVEVAEGGRFAQLTLAAGALRQRIETRVLALSGAEIRLDGLYLLAGRRHSDQTTEIRHRGRGGRSRQLVKGFAAGQARSVFQGRIVVEPGADGTDARLGSHALVLSDRAEVDAKPELEIYADDVQCAHGNTVGALDPDALFYVRSRGVPDAEAVRLLTLGFLGEVAEAQTLSAFEDLARSWILDQAGSLL